MLRAYKYRIYPTKEQQQSLASYFGSCRFVYNLGLETKISTYIGTKKNLTCFDLSRQMKELKDTDAKWLGEVPAQSLQMSLRSLDNAYTQFFKGNGFPKFKNKYSKQSIHFPQGVSVDFEKNTITVPKLKKIQCLFSRQFKGRIKTVTISKTVTNKYFVSILVDNQAELPIKKKINESTTVGIDMGVKTFATLSSGEYFSNPSYLRNNLKRLKREQRTLSRRFKKGAKEQTKNYQKQKLVVALLNERIKNQRTDYLQKTSTKIIKNYDTIVLENLNIKGMMKNHKLSLAIGDVGWNQFEKMLSYKSDWYGKNIVYIGRFEPSSKLCSKCGLINKELSLKQRAWNCMCGAKHDRDVNASINIKKFGLKAQPLNANARH